MLFESAQKFVGKMFYVDFLTEHLLSVETKIKASVKKTDILLDIMGFTICMEDRTKHEKYT